MVLQGWHLAGGMTGDPPAPKDLTLAHGTKPWAEGMHCPVGGLRA